jgi:hypothetical protein
MPTDITAVAAVFMKISEYQTKAATCMEFVRHGALSYTRSYSGSHRQQCSNHHRLELWLLHLPSLGQLLLVAEISRFVRRTEEPLNPVH